jgi:hypothetical protein
VPHECCQVLELRQYTLHPGGRDVLAALFESDLLEAQEATGMHVPGLFRDLDDPDRLVWWRGFRDMASRRRALTDFYLEGSAWRQHSAAANATMVDSDDVLLLEPAHLGSGFPTRSARRRPATGTTTAATAGTVGSTETGELVVDVVPRSRLSGADGSAETIADRVVEAARAVGGEVLLVAVSAGEPNDFPALPVRDEEVAVWMVRYPDEAARRGVAARLDVRATDERVRLAPLPGSQIG